MAIVLYYGHLLCPLIFFFYFGFYLEPLASLPWQVKIKRRNNWNLLILSFINNSWEIFDRFRGTFWTKISLVNHHLLDTTNVPSSLDQELRNYHSAKYSLCFTITQFWELLSQSKNWLEIIIVSLPKHEISIFCSTLTSLLQNAYEKPV